MTLSILAGWGLDVNAQDSLSQIRSTSSNGARWSSGGAFAHFGIAGQSAVSSRIGEGDFAGSVGFLFSSLEKPPTNEPPIAISKSKEFYHNLDGVIYLKGYDPEGQPIDFQIVRQPINASIEQQGANNDVVKIIPNNDLLSDLVYHDSFQFIVKEKDTELVSDTAIVLFQFRLRDKKHHIIGLSKNQTDFTLELTDAFKNPAYNYDINYYDLSDITNPQIVSILKSSIAKENLTLAGDTLSNSFSVDETTHGYLFSTSQVLITVLVTTDNGFSDFESYILNNDGGRISGSEDGQFFVIGSEQSLPENESITLKMLAVEFADFDMSQATIEVLTDGKKGVFDNIQKIETKTNLITWEGTYTSTQDVGGLDSVQFRVFHPGRNLYDTAYVKVNVKDVNDAPTIVELLDKQISEDSNLTLSVNASDPDNELVLSVVSNEATNVPVTIVNNEITISPISNYFGSVTITITATETGTTDEFSVIESFDLTIIPENDPPVVASLVNKQADEDNVISVALNATDPDSDISLFSFSASSSNPAIAKVSIIDNLLTVTPEVNANGTVTISVFADDKTGTSNAVSSSENFELSINPINDAPLLIKSLATQELVVGFPQYDIELGSYFSDVETASSNLTYSIVNNTNVNVSFTGSKATISLVAGFTGVENLTFTASDGEASVDMPVTFVVTQSSSGITTGTIANISLIEDFNTHVLDISGVFIDANNLAFTYELFGNRDVAFAINENAKTITFSSTTNFNGSESLFLVAKTSNGSAFTNFNLTVDAVNDAPLISNISNQTIFEDGAFSGLLLEVSDVDNTNSELTITAVSSVQSLIADSDITISNSNGFYFISASPKANQNGDVEFTVSVTDGILSNSTKFSINVAAVNDLPIVTKSTIDNPTEDIAYSISLLDLFSDPDGNELTFNIENKPTWLQLDGTTLSGTPTNNDVASNSMQITAADPFNGQVISLYNFSVINVNDAPVLLDELPDFKILQENSFSYLFPTASFQDVDLNDVLTYSVEKYPSWATLSNNNLSGTPQYENIGRDTLVFKAIDLAGLFITDTVVIDVEFTVYDAALVTNNVSICSGESTELSVSGAVDYNWYDINGNVLQAGGSKYSLAPTASIQVLVEGTDGLGNNTPTKTTIEVTVNSLPDVNIVQNKNNLSVPESPNGTYTWFLDGVELTGSDSHEYDTQQSGIYSVEVTSEFGCFSKSEALNFVLTGLEINGLSLEIYPNPVDNVLNISGINQFSREINWSILDINGRLIKLIGQNKNNKRVINTSSLKPGVYVLLIKTNHDLVSYRFIKN